MLDNEIFTIILIASSFIFIIICLAFLNLSDRVSKLEEKRRQ